MVEHLHRPCSHKHFVQKALDMEGAIYLAKVLHTRNISNSVGGRKLVYSPLHVESMFKSVKHQL